MSVVVRCRSIFFPKAATFMTGLGMLDAFEVICTDRDANQSEVPGESKSLAVMTRRPGVVTGC